MSSLGRQPKQAGVTLLLAILVLSAITAIAFSLATIVFIEIRASSDLQRTEPALYATQSVIEEAILKVKRGVPDSNANGKDFSVFNSLFGSCSTPNASNLNSTVLSTNLCSLNLDPVYNDVVPSTSDAFNKTKNVYTLLNPDAPYVDSDANGSPDGLYGKITFTYASGPAMRVYICKITNVDCTDSSNNQNGSADYSVANGQLLNATNGNGVGGGCSAPIGSNILCYILNPNASYQIFVHLDTPPTPTQNGYFQIHTCAGNNGSPTDSTCTPLQYRGIAFPGKKTVDVSANAGGILTRKYRVFIPQ